MGALREQQDPNGNECENPSSDDSKQDSVLAIMDFMNSYVRKIDFSPEKNFIFILGNTGAGKSTLASLLTDAEITSTEVRDDLGEFIITDKKGLISGVSTTTSKTIVPELMNEQRNGIIYYDCPVFNDSRSVSHDISVTYLIQKLIKYAQKLKLVFAVSYTAVKVGTGDRRDFMDLAKHAITFVKNMDKYRNGIALVVTKVENRYVMKNKQPHLVDDCKIIEGVVEFLKQAKLDLEGKINGNISSEERDFNSKKIQFIDILLQTNDRNEYEKIKIMRLANENGPVQSMNILQTEKKAIQSMIAQKIQYISKENSDFGYTISDESKNRLHETMEQMQQCLVNDLMEIGNEIKDYYIQQEKCIADLIVLKETISCGHQKLCGISATNFKEFTKLIVDAANDLGIGVTFEHFNQIWRHIECVEFITTVSKSDLSSLFDITKGLANTMQYLDES